MRLQGTTLINAARPVVWEFVTDGEKVAQCAPGVEKIEIIEPRRKFKAVLSVGFGTVKAKFNAEIEFTEWNLDATPPEEKPSVHRSAYPTVRSSVTVRAGANATLTWP